VLQTPGAAYGAWSILDALLTPTGAGTPFVFSEPLGQAREVKVALSGLFGRFVARAYLERYFNLSIFAHLGSRMIDLDRRRQVKITRLSRGDLPDWIACAADLSSLTVAEAKGCHDVGGPAKALDRAWAQARRIDVTARGRKVTVKRIAIATRWGMATAGPAEALLSVRDPVEEGEPHTPASSTARGACDRGQSHDARRLPADDHGCRAPADHARGGQHGTAACLERIGQCAGRPL
jgi:hypothetical protein